MIFDIRVTNIISLLSKLIAKQHVGNSLLGSGGFGRISTCARALVRRRNMTRISRDKNDETVKARKEQQSTQQSILEFLSGIMRCPTSSARCFSSRLALGVHLFSEICSDKNKQARQNKHYRKNL